MPPKEVGVLYWPFKPESVSSLGRNTQEGGGFDPLYGLQGLQSLVVPTFRPYRPRIHIYGIAWYCVVLQHIEIYLKRGNFDHFLRVLAGNSAPLEQRFCLNARAGLILRLRF